MMTTRNKPLVSVIIPLYNCERYLTEAIESVLAQTYRPVEIIVVDDGSTDSSAEAAKRFAPSVRYYFQPHKGVAAAQNRGVDSARGDFFAFLDADDLWVESKLTRQMAVFDNDPRLDIVFGHVEQFYSPELDGYRKETDYSASIMPGYSAGTMLIRRDAFFRVGPFEIRWRVGQFVDWYSRAVEKRLRTFMLPDVVMKRRLHAANMGIRERESQTDYVRILKASLDRRRKMNLRGQYHTSESK